MAYSVSLVVNEQRIRDSSKLRKSDGVSSKIVPLVSERVIPFVALARDVELPPLRTDHSVPSGIIAEEFEPVAKLHPKHNGSSRLVRRMEVVLSSIKITLGDSQGP